MDGGKLQWTKAILCLTKQRATFLWHGVHSLWGHESMLPYCHCYIHLPEREKKYLKEWEANFKRLPLQLINQHGLSGSCCKVQVDHHSRYHRYKKAPIHHSLLIAISVQPAFYQTASTVMCSQHSQPFSSSKLPSPFLPSHCHPATLYHHFHPARFYLQSCPGSSWQCHHFYTASFPSWAHKTSSWSLDCMADLILTRYSRPFHRVSTCAT